MTLATVTRRIKTAVKKLYPEMSNDKASRTIRHEALMLISGCVMLPSGCGARCFILCELWTSQRWGGLGRVRCREEGISYGKGQKELIFTFYIGI